MGAVAHGVIDAKFSTVFYGFYVLAHLGKTCRQGTGRTKHRIGASSNGCIQASWKTCW
jgi:hypothetical protein